MTIDFSIQERLRAEQAKHRAQADMTGSRGGEPPDDLGRRVLALEVTVASIDRTLAVISEQLKHVASKSDLAIFAEKLDAKASRDDLVALSGKIDRMALATELAELKGRVSRIPTVPVLTSILVFVSLLFAAATWVLRHLPPAWVTVFQ